MAVAACEKGCWWLLRLPGEGGCWLRLARRVVAGTREVLHVAGYNCQGQQQGASIKEVGRQLVTAGREGTRRYRDFALPPASYLPTGFRLVVGVGKMKTRPSSAPSRQGGAACVSGWKWARRGGAN